MTVFSDWRSINELQAQTPLTFARDEDGAPISRGSIAQVVPPPELDEELALDLTHELRRPSP